MNTRPTPDRLRETLFDILAPRIANTAFADAYAGTGAVGIEALSRGASRAIFIERSRAAVEVIRDNLAALDLTARAEVFTGKSITVLERIEADIVFLDPPYDLARELDAALAVLESRETALVIAQHPSQLDLKPNYGRLARYRVVKQGDNSLSFFS